MLALDFSIAYRTVLPCFFVRSVAWHFWHCQQLAVEGVKALYAVWWTNVSDAQYLRQYHSSVKGLQWVLCLTSLTQVTNCCHAGNQIHKNTRRHIHCYTSQQHSVQRRWTQQRGVQANNLKLNRTKSIEIIFTGNRRQLQGPVIYHCYQTSVA